MQESKVVRFPNNRRKATRDVKSIFKKMMAKSEQQGWNQLIIIGRGKNTGSWHISKMELEIALGMLEKTKLLIAGIDEPEID